MRSGTSVKSLLLLTVCGLVLCLQVGCPKKVSLLDVYNSNIKKIHVCYTIFMENNGFKGPKDEQEFKSFLSTDQTAMHLLKRINLNATNLESTFVCERDGEPFVIRYGVQGMADHAIVFEKTGVDGKRYVALTEPIELDAAAYDGYLSGKTKAKAVSGGGGGLDDIGQ